MPHLDPIKTLSATTWSSLSEPPANFTKRSPYPPKMSLYRAPVRTIGSRRNSASSPQVDKLIALAPMLARASWSHGEELRGTQRRLTVGLLLLFALIMILGYATSMLGTLSPAELRSVQADSVRLEVNDWHWRRSAGGGYFIITEGSATNTGHMVLRGVEAVVSFYDHDGNLLATEAAPVEGGRILPGRTAPWSVWSEWNPAVHSVSLGFERDGGLPIRTSQE